MKSFTKWMVVMLAETAPLKVGKNPLFKYSPLPTIPFYDSGFDSTIHAELADDTSKV